MSPDPGTRKRTESNLADKTIRTTWKVLAFTMQKVYSLDEYATVAIKDKGQVLEGYSMPLFFVQLVGRRKQIAIYSTDDPDEAKAVQGEISGFLKKPDYRHKHMNKVS